MQNYEVNNVSIDTILGYVKDGTVAIPEIQRPFVWDSVKVRKLIDSLYNGYPTGYIITWKSNSVKLKDGSSSEGKQILIDGQQRITALMASLLGKEVLDENYEKNKIKIAFNIKEEKFETCNPTIEKQDEWIPDISAFMIDGAINIYEFVTSYSQKHNIEPEIVNKRINQLLAIKAIQIGRIELHSELDIDTVTEIFVRINSEGKSLSQADFAMSKISVNENYNGNEIRKTIDYFCHLAKNPNDYDRIKENDKEFSSKDIFKKVAWVKDKADDIYVPDYTDVLRVAFTFEFKRGKLSDLVSLLSGRDFETKEYKESIIEDSFTRLYLSVKKYINQSDYERYVMILKSAGLIDNSLLGSQNVLNFGYILYLLLKEKGIQHELIQKYVAKWVIMSIITQRYTSSPETRFDVDIRRLTEVVDIEKYINEEIERELNSGFWDNTLVERLNTAASGSLYWKMFLVAQIKLNNRAFLSKDINVRTLIENRGDVHHIFPKKYLKKNGFKKSQYNQIANFVMLETPINIRISDDAPKKYIGEVYKQITDKTIVYGAINTIEDLEKNFAESCIPKEIKNMDVNDYDNFLLARRKLMAERIKEYYYSLS